MSADDYSDEDMAAVGRDLMQSLKANSGALRGWAPCDSPAEIVSDLINARDEMQGRVDSLFDAIKHGDEVHREWLKEAITKHFAFEAVPPPRAAPK